VTSDSFGEARATGDLLREVLGCFASGIVIVSAVHHEKPVGFTCQSFFSVSLEPPLIALCPSCTSSTWPKIRESGVFCVNVLAAGHSDLSSAFARSGSDKFAGVAWVPAPSGSPRISGVSAWIDCRLEQEHDAGDHMLVVGRVHALGYDPNHSPLLYHRGVYQTTADCRGCDGEQAGDHRHSRRVARRIRPWRSQ
jgi:3-hydroxy-9,10-secoandrosta-1,3,5(10)-triene-9,17-dione monooxygenase reductase component